MDVNLTRSARLRVTSDDVLDHNGPREDLRGLVHLKERVQQRLATRPTGHAVQVQPGNEEVVVLRVDDVLDGPELAKQLMSHIRQCVRHLHPYPAV